MTLSARCLALTALHRFAKNGSLVSDTLREKLKALPAADQRLAFELASGTIRRYWTIEWYAQQLVTRELPHKPLQKFLLFMALYQRLFHEHLPPHALIFEYVELAKKACNTSFASCVNAILRKSLQTPILLPQGSSPEDLSIRHSFPPSFIRRLLAHKTLEQTVAILEALNVKLPSFKRGKGDQQQQQFLCVEEGDDGLFALQNPTQPAIFAAMSQRISPPQRILDLCAGAGGKSLMAWEVFHPTTLLANDLSHHRLQHLLEQAHTHKAAITISCSDALLLPEDNTFDLVIVDPPCSNSGVLFKCPEARHRLDDNAIRSHLRLQQALLKKSQKLLSFHGSIFYSTCSILPEENEEMVASAAATLHLTVQGPPIHILPDGKQYEGGFGALLQPSGEFRSN